MSRQADEASRRGQQKPAAPKKKAQGRGGIVSFHPTVAEAAELKMGVMDIDTALDYLTKVMERGVGLSLGYNIGQGAFFALAKDKTGDWKTAATVSAWHSSTHGAIRALAYVLSRRYPSFPDDVEPATEFRDEW